MLLYVGMLACVYDIIVTVNASIISYYYYYLFLLFLFIFLFFYFFTVTVIYYSLLTFLSIKVLVY